jgi:SAM-dependent methyltransferase
VLLDVGCGFPPYTAVDAARRLSEWRVIGMDRAFAHYLIEDDVGYASFDAACRLRYFQPKSGIAVRWDDMLRTRDATTRRLAALLDQLLPLLPADDGTCQVARHGTASIVRRPIRAYERANLGFTECDIGTLPVARDSVDVVRCMNVLMYFDRGFRERTLDWAESLLVPGGLFVCGCMSFSSTFARYTVYQKVDRRIVPREFAFSVDNIRPAGFMPCYTFHDDDADVLQLVQAVAQLRSDLAFRRAFDPAADAAFAAAGVARRLENGYLSGSAHSLPTGELSKRTADLADRLRNDGAAEWAVDALRRHGVDAWVNSVNDVALPVSVP